MSMFKHRRFTGNVEIMGTDFQTAFNHWRAGGRKRPGTMQHQAETIQSNTHGLSIIQIKNPGFQVQLGSQRLEFVAAAAGEDRLQAKTNGFAGNQLAGITVGTINHPLHGLTPWWQNAGTVPTRRPKRYPLTGSFNN